MVTEAARPVPDPGPATDFERTVLDNLYEGVYFVDLGRRIHDWNRGAERLSGFEASAVVGRFCHDNLLNHVDEAGRQLCRSGCPLAATMRDGAAREADVFLRHRSGHRVGVRVRTSPVRDRDGRIVGGVEIFDDQTDLSTARRELSDMRDLAMTDTLTGIPNRRHFEMAVASRVAELAGYGRPFGLLVADVDHFKRLNDTHGHATGDAALRTIARTMLESTRPSDDIARYGGEEFVLTVSDVDADGLRGVATRLRTMVAKSLVRAGDRRVRVTVSVGGALAAPGERAAAVFERADGALYRAKQAGRNRVEIDAGEPGQDGPATTG
jgi:diguanylate cyclase (GGDEF)-like protein/PAS domain S-box-containing protein